MAAAASSSTSATKEEEMVDENMLDREVTPPLEDDPDAVYLRPKLSLLNGVTVIVGSVIGSGIFISPKGVIENTGSVGLSLVVWIVSGIFSTVGAYCYAELGCMITKTGADYAYIMESYGPFLAFLRLWVECIIIRPCSIAIVALTFSIYILQPIFHDCGPPNDAVHLLAALCICVLSFVNCWNVKWSSRVQDIFTFGKLFALTVIIVTGIVQLGYNHTENFNFEGSESDVGKIGLAFYSGLFAYNGWNYLNFVIEELKDPHKNLPIAIFMSCGILTFVYTMTIVAYHTVLSVSEVESSIAVAVTFGDRMYGAMAWIMPLSVAMSTFGGVNGILLSTSRLFYAGAAEGQMPKILAMIQIRHMTPAPAVMLTALLSLIYTASENNNIFALINYVSFATWLAIGLGVSCLPYLRWKRPDLSRPIKVNLIFPVIYVLASVFIIIIPMTAAPKETGFGALIIASAIPIYFIFIYWENKPKVVRCTIDSFTAFCQKLFLVVPSEKS